MLATRNNNYNNNTATCLAPHTNSLRSATNSTNSSTQLHFILPPSYTHHLVYLYYNHSLHSLTIHFTSFIHLYRTRGITLTRVRLKKGPKKKKKSKKEKKKISRHLQESKEIHRLVCVYVCLSVCIMSVWLSTVGNKQQKNIRGNNIKERKKKKKRGEKKRLMEEGPKS